MKPTLTVLKVGGKLLDDKDILNVWLAQLPTIQSSIILVHGGGVIATELASKLGIETVMKEGRRITDQAMLDVVTMAYGGLVNKQLVVQLQAKGINALGMSGADANVVLSEKRAPKNGIDYGWVGDPIKIDTNILRGFLSKNIVPVIAPLTHDGHGHLLNTNADTLATSIAKAMMVHYDVRLWFAFEKAGVLMNVQDESSIIATLDQSMYDALKSVGKIHTGMLPKLENAFDAAKAGVSDVRILKYENLQNGTNHGTVIQP